MKAVPGRVVVQERHGGAAGRGHPGRTAGPVRRHPGWPSRSKMETGTSEPRGPPPSRRSARSGSSRARRSGCSPGITARPAWIPTAGSRRRRCPRSSSHRWASSPADAEPGGPDHRTEPTEAPATSQGDPHLTLGVAPGASLNEIKSAYRRLGKKYHPDAGGARLPPRFLAIQAARTRPLGDAGRRRRRPRPGRRVPEQACAARDGPAAGRGAGSRLSADRRTAATRRATGSGATGDRRAGARDPGRARSSARRRPRKATPGSTTYDEAAETPLDPAWDGGAWYGPSSGTYWTLNPREYADPRKHGPEYLARARAARPGPRGRPLVDRGGPDAAGCDPGTPQAADADPPPAPAPDARPARRRSRTSPCPRDRAATPGRRRVRIRPSHPMPARPGPFVPARHRLAGRSARDGWSAGDAAGRCGRVRHADRSRPGGRDCDGACSASAPSPGGVSSPRPGGIGGEPGRYDGAVSRRASSDLSGAAQEYLLALRCAAVDGARRDRGAVARHVGVTTQAASEMYRRLAADGLVEPGRGTRADAHPARPRGRGRRSSVATPCSSGC